MSGDSNRMRKTHSHHLESYVVGTNHREEDAPIINFRLANLEGVTTPHKDVLVIRATIVNYEVAQVFVDSESSVNILFKEAFNQMQIVLV